MVNFKPLMLVRTGAGGFEPTNGEVKVRCLTAWLRPIILFLSGIYWHRIKTGKKGFEPLTPWFVAMCSSPLSYKPYNLLYHATRK